MKRWTLRRTLQWLGLFLLAFLGAFKIAEWTSDVWWNTALGQRDTYVRIFQCRLVAFVCAASVWGAIWSSNLRLAWFYVDGRAQVLELLGPHPRDEFFALPPRRERGMARARRLASHVVFWSALWLAGLAAANRFDLWLPLRHIMPVGQIEPVSGRDLSFFFWVLPALDWGWNFFGVALVSVLLVCVALYTSAELIETGPQLFRVAPRAAWHLLTLGATLVLWQGVRQGLNILGAPISPGWTPNTIFGAPEAHFTVPTRFLLLASSLPIAGLILLMSRRGRLNAASGLLCGWMAGALLLPSLAAPFGRSLRLDDKAEQQVAINRHLEATRMAWGLEGITRRIVDVPSQATEFKDEGTSLTQSALSEIASANNFGQFPLWPAATVKKSLEIRETNSARRLGALHLEVTGGRLVYRALAANPTASNDFPAVVYEIDATANPLSEPRRINISSLLIGEFVAGERPRTPPERSDETYGGTPSSSDVPLPRWRATQRERFAVDRQPLWHRLALGLRFFDFSLLRTDTKAGNAITWRLDPVARAQSLMPVVDWSGADPRTIVVQEQNKPRPLWLLMGCFGSRFYPSSAMLPTGSERRGVNYLRENVLAVIDATTGETSFYLLDADESLAGGWRRSLPTAFRDISALPEVLRSQVRPSPSLLDNLATIWSHYRPAVTTDASGEWAQGSDNWRPLLTNQGEATWNMVLPEGSSRPWLSCPFATSGGQAKSTGTALVSVLTLPQGVPELAPTSPSNLRSPSNSRMPSSSWIEWRTTRPLSVPSFAGPEDPRLVRGQVVLPAPTITAVFPRMRSTNDGSDGLLLSHGAPVSNVLPPAVVTRLPSFSPLRDGNSSRTPVETPKIAVHYALWGTSRPVQAPREMESLAKVRVLWEQLLQARRTGQWSEVAGIESQLSQVLGISQSEPGTTNTGSTAPMPAATRP